MHAHLVFCLSYFVIQLFLHFKKAYQRFHYACHLLYHYTNFMGKTMPTVTVPLSVIDFY
jgi:hypothetical protein